MSKINGFVKLMRPQQWFKSLYVIFGAAPAIFFMSPSAYLSIILLFFGIANLILVQGVIYSLNDIADREQDAQHPTKKFRPIARGVISPGDAKGFLILLAALSFFTGWLLDRRVVWIDFALIMASVLYSFPPLRLKDRRYLDVLFAALNFPLRVMVGWFIFEPFNNAKLSLQYSFLSTNTAPNTIQAIFLNAPPRVLEFSLRFSSISLSFIAMMAMTYSIAVFLLSLKRLAEKLDPRVNQLRRSLNNYAINELQAISILAAVGSFVSAFVLAWSLKPVLGLVVFPASFLLYKYYLFAFEKNSFVKEPETLLVRAPWFAYYGIIILILSALILYL